MDDSTLHLLVAIALFSVPTLLAGEHLPQRGLGGWRPTRPVAQAAGALVGLVLGVGFLLLLTP